MRRASSAAAFAVLLCAATAENRRAGAYALEKCKSGPMPAKLVLACNNATDAWNAEDGCDRDDDDDDDDDDDEPCGGGGEVSLRVVNARVYRAEANLALLLRDAVTADILFRLADAMARDETSDLRERARLLRRAGAAGTASPKKRRKKRRRPAR
jgi:hypothetical protein